MRAVRKRMSRLGAWRRRSSWDDTAPTGRAPPNTGNGRRKSARDLSGEGRAIAHRETGRQVVIHRFSSVSYADRVGLRALSPATHSPFIVHDGSASWIRLSACASGGGRVSGFSPGKASLRMPVRVGPGLNRFTRTLESAHSAA